MVLIEFTCEFQSVLLLLLVGAGSLTIAAVDTMLPVTCLDLRIPDSSRGTVILDELTDRAVVESLTAVWIGVIVTMDTATWWRRHSSGGG